MSSLHEVAERDFTLPELEGYFFNKYPDADQDTYQALFQRLYKEPVGVDVGLAMLTDIKRRKDALKLSEAYFKLSQGTMSYDDVENLRQQNESVKVDHNGLVPVTTDLEELINAAYSEQGVRWRLSCLNKSLGSLRPGDFGFIFARPETGKTTFLASETTQFLTGDQTKVIWFNNEEQGNKVMLRVYQAYFGVTLDVLLSNVKKFKERWNEEVGSRFQMYDGAQIHRRQVENIVSRENPSVVIYDQLTKIKGFKADRPDLMLGEIFQWARELAKGAHAAIGVSQADGTAEGVRYLTMEHVANAKTAVQAEADWILGIGKTNQDGFENVRFLNISKNKLFGDKDSLPELKHGKFDVLIDPLKARYEDIVNYE